MKKLCLHTFEEIISVENLLEAWSELVKGKRRRIDVQEFEFRLMENIFALHRRLMSGMYQHGTYKAFSVSDPKRRRIHKANMTDRLLHRAIYRKLYPFFDQTFISDSFSCRIGKGTHKALDRFRRFAWQGSHNHRQTIWVLKCDIRKFFASIDHDVLMRVIDEQPTDKRVVRLLRTIVESFHTLPRKGLPLGNLTSQLFANVYMNIFDQYVKCRLQVKHYLRYADDFVLLFHDRNYLLAALDLARDFLSHELQLDLHPEKIEISTFASGIDFLGWTHFSDHRILRTVTKRRIFAAIVGGASMVTIESYKGTLSHGNTRMLFDRITRFS